MMRILSSLVLIAAIGCGRAEKPEGSARAQSAKEPARADKAFPPADWTHKELADYLEKKKKVSVFVSPAQRFDGPGRLPAYFSENEPAKYPAVLVYKCDTAEIARAQAGAMGYGAFAFGHFAIGYLPGDRDAIDDGALMRRVTAALKR